MQPISSSIGAPAAVALHLFSVAVVTCGLTAGVVSPAFAQGEAVADPVKVLVERLDLEKYKATLKGLTQFGDRRQGTDRNQHDMMLFDHGMPRADGTMSQEQRPEADVNIEFQMSSKMAAESQKLAWVFEVANEKYATDYPAAVGSHMTNTDSGPFQDLIPAISLRENERGVHIGSGWDPQWHQPTDVFATYSNKDFRLGFNAAQTTLGAVGQLTGATVKP